MQVETKDKTQKRTFCYLQNLRIYNAKIIPEVYFRDRKVRNF